MTIYLPIYNKQKYLIESIRSVQKQTLNYIEIIAVNDYSTDNTLKILKKLSKKDPRIKIINNDNNHGLLYTRTMGILNSSGEFVMNLDPDDIIKESNSLQYIYNIAHFYNIDVVSFSFLKQNENHLKCFNQNKIINQPLLFESAFKNNKITDYILWNKLVKRQLMLKVYKIFKKRIYKNKWNYGEDTIWSILINKYAESMICINKTIYLYNINNDSLMKNNANIINLKNMIYYLEMNIKIFKNEIEHQYLISNVLDFFSYFKNENNLVITLLNYNLETKKRLINLLILLMRKIHIPFLIVKRIKILFYLLKNIKIIPYNYLNNSISFF